jgi:5-methylcytosine-specific restriction endonuclease McrA
MPLKSAEARAKKAAYMRQWSKDHAEERREYMRQWAVDHKEQCKVTAKKSRDRHVEANRKRAREWQRANPERMRAKWAAWEAAHPEQVRANRAVQNARRRYGMSIPVEQLQVKWQYWGGCCWMCGDEATTWDHVKPIILGGPHCLANLRPACKPCNSRKGARWPWPTRRSR